MSQPPPTEPLPTVVVTGISGNLGRALAKQLHVEAHVVGVDRRPLRDRPKDIEHHQVDLRKAKVEEAKAFLVANPGAVFRGPIKDNTGKEVLAAGVTADDKWKGEVNFYVMGVDGKVPSGK